MLSDQVLEDILEWTSLTQKGLPWCIDIARRVLPLLIIASPHMESYLVTKFLNTRFTSMELTMEKAYALCADIIWTNTVPNEKKVTTFIIADCDIWLRENQVNVVNHMDQIFYYKSLHIAKTMLPKKTNLVFGREDITIVFSKTHSLKETESRLPIMQFFYDTALFPATYLKNLQKYFCVEPYYVDFLRNNELLLETDVTYDIKWFEDMTIHAVKTFVAPKIPQMDLAVAARHALHEKSDIQSTMALKVLLDEKCRPWNETFCKVFAVQLSDTFKRWMNKSVTRKLLPHELLTCKKIVYEIIFKQKLKSSNGYPTRTTIDKLRKWLEIDKDGNPIPDSVRYAYLTHDPYAPPETKPTAKRKRVPDEVIEM